MKFSGTISSAGIVTSNSAYISVRESFRPQSERQLKIRLALESVVAAEKIEASEDDIEAEYKKIAEGYKTDLEKVKSTLSADTLVKDIVLRKAVDLIKENAAK